MKVKIGKYYMKKALLVFLLIYPIWIYGQNHLTFIGHPITGDVKTFVELLKADGFEIQTGKNWFPKMKTKYLRGNFWNFYDCDVVVRRPKKWKEITSVYVHPRNNFLLLNQLIDVLDSKYGRHEENFSDIDVNAITYTWSMNEGIIQIFGTVVYGQGFDIIYRDYTEVRLLNHIVNSINNDL